MGYSYIQFSGISLVRKLAYDAIESSLGQTLLFASIVLNTLLLAIERHNMSDSMRSFIYFSNFVFTIVFSIEMCLKMLGLGLLGYLGDFMNLMDAVVVLHSVFELYLDTGVNSLQAIRSLKGLRALKSMRALRALRAVRYLSALPKIIAIIMSCLKSFVAVLLVLFVF